MNILIIGYILYFIMNKNYLFVIIQNEFTNNTEKNNIYNYN